MTTLDTLLEQNRRFAHTGGHTGLTPMPRLPLLVLACSDGRVDPAHILGVDLGDALVTRNAGGRVTDEVIADIAFIGHLTDTLLGADAPAFEVAVIHHTECGTGMLADAEFRSAFAARLGVDGVALRSKAVTDPAFTVQRDVERLRQSPLVPGRVTVSGYVYDVGSGLVSVVVSGAA